MKRESYLYSKATVMKSRYERCDGYFDMLMHIYMLLSVFLKMVQLASRGISRWKEMVLFECSGVF